MAAKTLLSINRGDWLLDRVDLLLSLGDNPSTRARLKRAASKPLQLLLAGLKDPHLETVVPMRGDTPDVAAISGKTFLVRKYGRGYGNIKQFLKREIARQVQFSPMRVLADYLDPVHLLGVDDGTRYRSPIPENLLPDSELQEPRRDHFQKVQVRAVEKVAATLRRGYQEFVRALVGDKQLVVSPARFQWLEVCYDLRVEDPDLLVLEVHKNAKKRHTEIWWDSELPKVRWKVRDGAFLKAYKKSAKVLRLEIMLAGKRIREAAGVWSAQENVLVTVGRVVDRYFEYILEALRAEEEMERALLGEGPVPMMELVDAILDYNMPFLRGETGPALRKVLSIIIESDGRLERRQLNKDPALLRVYERFRSRGILIGEGGRMRLATPYCLPLLLLRKKDKSSG
ncbi:MAG: hypothetical protein O7H41_21415 [Planctomycetota bacterium]|nr:hypothetical protein [Planctomycetota bacterium]